MLHVMASPHIGMLGSSQCTVKQLQISLYMKQNPCLTEYFDNRRLVWVYLFRYPSNRVTLVADGMNSACVQWADSDFLNFKRQTLSIVQSDYDVLARDQCKNNALIVSYLQLVRGPNRLKARHHCWSAKSLQLFLPPTLVVRLCRFSIEKHYNEDWLKSSMFVAPLINIME